MNKSDREKRMAKFADAKELAEKQKGFEIACLRMPSNVKRFWFKEEKTYKLDILPYEVKKGKETLGGNPNCGEGCYTYERTFYVHSGIGPNNESHCCLAKTFGKECPICKSGRDDKPKKRQLILLKEKGDNDWKVYEGPHYTGLGSAIDNKVDAIEEENDPRRRFYSPWGGYTLHVKVTKQGWKNEHTGAGGSKLNPTNIEMYERADFPDDIIDEAPDLDSMLVELSYDKLKALYEGGLVAEDNSDDFTSKTPVAPPKSLSKAEMRKPARRAEEDEDEEEEVAPRRSKREEKEEEEEEKPVRSSSNGKHKTRTDIEEGDFVKWQDTRYEVVRIKGDTADLEDDDGNIERGVALDECVKVPMRGRKADEEEEEEESPRRSRK